MKADLLLAFWTQYSYLLNRTIFPLPSFVPEFSISTRDPIFDKYWSEIKNYTLLDIYRAKNIWNLAHEVKNLEGDFIECGSYRGGISFLLAFFIKHFRLNKKIFICDSFEGLPPPDPQRDQLFTAGILQADQEACRRFILDHGLSDIASIKAGWFSDTLITFPDEQQFCLIHLDCDLYQSTLTCFKNLYDRALLDSPIILDDYICYSPGERIATKEWLAETRESIELGPFSQAYFRKGKQYVHLEKTILDPEGSPIFYGELMKNKNYGEFLNSVISHYQLQASNLSNLSSTIFKDLRG